VSEVRVGCRPEDVRKLLDRLAAAAEETQDPVRRKDLTSVWGRMAIHSQRLADLKADAVAESAAGRTSDEVGGGELHLGRPPEGRLASQKGISGIYPSQLWTTLDDMCREALRLLGDALA
jgi:hypothetical protein